jgi:Holliday junction resolvase-like predicted endonuclease
MHRARKINRRQQGDLGEASAIEWLTRQGATIFTPFGHSPDIDLVAEIAGRLLRIQVKTSTCKRGRTYATMIATNGGNQSWSGVAKFFDPARCDLLFVLVGDGRRWLIPSDVIDGKRGINLGAEKYSEFEIEPGAAIEEIVYGRGSPLESGRPRGSTEAVKREAL